MKTRQVFLTILLAASLCLLNVITAFAEPPPLPSSFYGTVKLNGENVSAGTKVTAWINGRQFAEATVLTYEGDTVYALNVPGDVSSTTDAIEGGKSGDTILFQIGDREAQQSAVWNGGTNVEVKLTFVDGIPVTGETRIFIPLILKQP